MRTVPPREKGRNLDTKETDVGTTLLFPCLIDGCGLFAGDVHFAMGGGEVAGTAIETGAKVTLQARVIPGGASRLTTMHFEGSQGLTREQAYALVSVAVDLNIAQVVDVPNVGVTSILNRDVFKEQ